LLKIRSKFRNSTLCSIGLSNMDALRIAATGMMAQQRNTELIANNLANMNTAGFQRRRSEFNDLIYKNLERPDRFPHSKAGPKVPGGIHSGLGVSQIATYRVLEQGSLYATENSFDMGIDGAGYLQIQLPNGQMAYTRDGTLQLNAQGAIVTADGYPIEPSITIPGDTVDVTINVRGEVLALLDGETEPENLGVIQLAIFPNAGGLRSEGNNLFSATEASGEPLIGQSGGTGFGTLMQGFVERSNVNPVEEITHLITAQRHYEMNSKVIATAEQMMTPAKNR